MTNKIATPIILDDHALEIFLDFVSVYVSPPNRRLFIAKTADKLLELEVCSAVALERTLTKVLDEMRVATTGRRRPGPRPHKQMERAS